MGSTNLLGGEKMESQLRNWQGHQDGESEESSFTSSSMSCNFKSPSASLNEIDEYMYMLEAGGAAHENHYHDEMSYQKLPNLLDHPLLTIANSSLNTPSIITRDHYLITHEEAHDSSLVKNTFFLNPIDPQSLPYPLGFHQYSKANSTLAPSFMKNVDQAYDQTYDNPQEPLECDYALLHNPPSSLPPFVSASNNSYSKHLLANYGARQARQSHNLEYPTQPSNEALETTSNGPYMPYLPCISFTTSPTHPSTTSPNSSPITSSLASRTSTITDTAFVDAASLPLDHWRDNHFVNGSEMMPLLTSLHTRSLLNRSNSKGKNVKIDKVIKKKRKRIRSRKNCEELESQRMTHIAVERNRRRQMNQHLNDLRALMPSSYIQRGDQASIVGGAIRLVEELEQMLESLHLQKQIRQEETNPQVSLLRLDDDKGVSISNKDSYACLHSSMVNVQVEIISLPSVLVKVISPKGNHPLVHTLQALSFLSLKVLHLNITTFDISILYSFNLKMENDCQFQSALELARSIQHLFETLKIESG